MSAEPSGFTERDFYLAEFRKRTIAIALPAPAEADAAALSEVVSTLVDNQTRVVLLASATEGLAALGIDQPIDPGASDATEWIADVWRWLQADGVAGLRLPAETFASSCRAIGLRLGVAKLVWIQSEPVLRSAQGPRASSFDLASLERLAGGEAVGGACAVEEALPLLGEIQAMVEGGLDSVNVCAADGLADELFTWAGTGTFFSRERYMEVRALRIDDFEIAGLMILRGVAEGYLVERPVEEVDRILAHGFGVFVEGRYAAGIGALLPYPEESAGEIASLYTVTRFLGEGVGAQLIGHAIECACRQGFDYVFACTTSGRVQAFFERHGFTKVGQEQVPARKWKGYEPTRRDRVRVMRRNL